MKKLKKLKWPLTFFERKKKTKKLNKTKFVFCYNLNIYFV